MGLETGDTIASLNASWPLGSDPRSEGDDHLRLLKRVLQNDVVPAAGGAFTGPVRFRSGGSAGDPNVRLGSSAIGFHTYGDEDSVGVVVGGDLVALFDSGGSSADGDSTVLTREKGDARYFWKDVFNFSHGNYDETSYSAAGTYFQPGSLKIKRSGHDDVASTAFELLHGTSGGQRMRKMRIRTDGNLENLHNSYGGLSDARLKENIKDAGGQLDDLLKLRIVHFNMIGDPLRQLGLIAQEVEQIKPGLVDEDTETGMKSLKYSVLVPMLVKAVQELTARVAALEAAG